MNSVLKNITKFYNYFGLIFSYFFVIIWTDDHNWILPIMQMIVLLYSLQKSLREILIFLSPFLFLILVSTIFFPETLSKGLLYLVLLPIIGFIGYSIHYIKFFYILIIGILFIGFSNYYIMPNWIYYNSNNSSHINKPYPSPLLYTKDLDQVKFEEEKIIVLDFWTTSCKICYEKFPHLEKFIEKYEEKEEVEFYSVNVQTKSNSFEKTLKLVNSLNYKFKTIFALDNEEIEKQLEIKFYPTVIIIKNGKMRYKGSFITDKKIFVHRLEDEIKRIRNDNK